MNNKDKHSQENHRFDPDTRFLLAWIRTSIAIVLIIGIILGVR